ncbi:GPI ethanolamine phosphate transferase 3, catalytic subunit [Stigmatopora argus]
MRGLPSSLFLLLWLTSIYLVGIYLFMSGFLLLRVEVNRTSTCADVLEPSDASTGASTGASTEAPTGASRDFCAGHPRFARAVLLIVDALKLDFARFDPRKPSPAFWENKLRVFEETASSRPTQCRLYPFRADPPTTTMQRIKGLTTGSLPTFVDVGNNFASSAVLEDNLIHQFAQVGKRVVFMGDDTWESLFPKKFYRSLPFPSFNVKDLHTVDNGILQDLYTTMTGDRWDILIAHFLGVDHCGHTFGPDHPAMADKLVQMDGVIRSVMDRMQNDTILLVMGDHGMTDTGDHGGESQKETDSAIFLYSPVPLFPAAPSQNEPDVVPQTDLVPTLALLLGVPIPYSSVGQVLLPLFPPLGAEATSLGQLEALWINAKQVNRFLESYSALARDMPPETLNLLRDRFEELSRQYLQLARGGRSSSPSSSSPSSPRELLTALQAYLASVRDACRAIWARFSPLRMAGGVVVLALACAASLAVSETVSRAPVAEGAFPAKVAVAAGICAAGAQRLLGGQVEWAWCAAASASASALSLVFRALRPGAATANGARAAAAAAGAGGRIPDGLLWPPLLATLFRCVSAFSDSYVLAEGRVVAFLLLSLALCLLVALNWEGLLLLLLPPASQDPWKPASARARKESGALVAFFAPLLASLYLSLFFHGCREGDVSCRPSPFLSSLARVKDNRLKNLYYVLSVLSLAGWTSLLRRCLRHYGNLNSRGGTASAARWILPSLSACVALHWAVGASPEEDFKNLAELIRLARLVLPRAAYALLGLGLALIWLDPLSVFVKARRPAGGPPRPSVAAAMPPRYRASTGMSPQAELRHLIPQIYQRMRHSLNEEGGAAATGSPAEGPAVEAYGLGSVYSAPLLLLCGLLGLGLMQLHPEGMALSFLLLLVQTGALLHIHASSTALHRLQGVDSGGFDVPWSPIVLWSLTASQFFHATGHLPSFPSIQWGAAFVGFPDGHAGTWLPASLVALNTFASHILFAVGCPLLLFWPLVREVRVEKGEGDAVMEMRLREKPQMFRRALLQLSTRYLFLQGAQVFSSACAAALLRRHLMVWGVFAPKLIFEASAFVASCVGLLLGVSLVLRVDVAVGRWFQRLVPDASR